MEDIKTIKNIQDIQALRISGALFLLKKRTEFNVFDEAGMKINEDCFIEFLRKQEMPPDLKERFRYYAKKNEIENMRYHEGLLYQHIKEFLSKEISESVFLFKVNNLLSDEKKYLKTIQFQGFDFPDLNFEKDFKSEDYRALKRHKKFHSHFILAPKPKNSIFTRKKKLLTLNDQGIVKKENIRIPKKELCLEGNELFGSNLMTGVTGSGVLKSGLSLFSQNILKGNGGFYFTSTYDYEDKALYSVARSLKREDDFLFLNLLSFREVFSFNFKDAIQTNKIIVFTGSNNSNTQIKMSNLADELMQFILLKIQDLSIENEGFMFMFHKILNSFSLNEDLFAVMNRLLKERGLTSFFLESGEFWLEGNIPNFLEKYMENFFIFRQEMDLNKALNNDIKELAKNLDVGEFLHFKSLKENIKNKNFEKYLSYYNDGMKFKDVYETMF